MKRLLLDLPKLSDWKLFKSTIVVMSAVSIFVICILPVAMVVVWFLITALIGPLF